MKSRLNDTTNSSFNPYKHDVPVYELSVYSIIN